MKGSKKPSQTSALSVPGLDLRQLEEVLSFMNEHGLEEFEYNRGDLRIRLKKAPGPAIGSGGRAVPSAPVPATAEAPVHSVVETAVPVQASAAAPAAAAPAENQHIIKSPIVGTFYRGANPEAGPFVKLGDVVEAGRTICIVEAMKLMNEIEADIAGEIVKIYIENGEPVEYGEPLFALRPVTKSKS